MRYTIRPLKYTSIFQYSKLNVFKDIKLCGEIFIKRRNDALGTDVYKTIESYW